VCVCVCVEADLDSNYKVLVQDPDSCHVGNCFQL